MKNTDFSLKHYFENKSFLAVIKETLDILIFGGFQSQKLGQSQWLAGFGYRTILELLIFWEK